MVTLNGKTHFLSRERPLWSAAGVIAGCYSRHSQSKKIMDKRLESAFAYV